MIQYKGLMFFVLLLLQTLLFTPTSTFAETNETIEKLATLAALEEDQIDIGRVALTLTKEAYPELDVEEYSARIDDMVEQVRILTKGSQDPDFRVRALNTYLYKYIGLRYDPDDLYARKLKNRYLNGLLDTRTGSCTTMPLLYLSIAQRLGYPVYPVSAPQHLFLRYVDPSLKNQNIEATSSGGFSSDEEYAIRLEIPQKGIESGAYMETMTFRQLVGDLIAEQGAYWVRQGDWWRAIIYYRTALQLNPKAAEVYRLLAFAHYKAAEQNDKVADILPPFGNHSIKQVRWAHRAQERAHQEAKAEAMQHANDLGVAPLLKENYWIRQQQLAEETQRIVIK